MPRYLKVARQHKDDGSILTEADIAAQAALNQALPAIHDAPVLGEEMTLAEQQAIWNAGGDFWCVDPIDGTSNFVNGIPNFAVSIALMRQHRPVLGVVYDPVADEAYAALQGKGAYLWEEPLPIKSFCPAGLAGSIACIDLKRLPRDLRARLGEQPPYRSQRNFGSSALDWCYVAAGRCDIYLHGGQKLWDYAAGSLILAEAGGHMATMDGQDFWQSATDADRQWPRSVVAALNPRLFSVWQDWLRGNA